MESGSFGVLVFPEDDDPDVLRRFFRDNYIVSYPSHNHEL